MPARSSRKSTARGTDQSDEVATYNVPHLSYNEPLSWPAGRAISVGDLFSRLKALSDELKEIEQGTIQPQDIAKLAQDLVHPNLLGHKDKGVRAWTLVCVIEILNQCAPNAPFSPGKLKDIFTVVTSTILPALADPSNAYNQQHQYILDQLVETRCVALMADLPDPDSLLSQLFSVCFDIVSGTSKNTSGVELSQSVVFQLGMLLNVLVEECTLPQEVIDSILSQFLRVDPRTISQTSRKKTDTDRTQSTLSLKEYPPAYNMAKNICTTCSDKMAAIISQYFSAIITNASAALAADDEKQSHAKRAASVKSDSEEDHEQAFSDLIKAHGLVKELWRACPDVLVNVMPQLDLEMAADSSKLRSLAVETVGDLVSGVGLAGMPELPVMDPATYPSLSIRNFAAPVLSTNPLLLPSAPKPFIQVHAPTYAAFMGRRIDRAVVVRKAWVTASCRILLTNAGGIGLNKDEQKTLIESYTGMLKDVDDDIRFMALEELGVFSYLDVVDVLGQDGGLSEKGTVLSTIAERLYDKRSNVREHAMKLLGSIWGIAWQDICDNEEQAVWPLRSIPSQLLQVFFMDGARAHTLTTLPRILYDCLLPLNWPPTKSKVPASAKKHQKTEEDDSDQVRGLRLLTLVRDLNAKTRPVFFGILKRQAELARALSQFVDLCSEYNGGVGDDNETETRLRQHITKYINSFSGTFPDPQKASKDLWQFVKNHDRRNYHLIKFACGSEYDYKTMAKAVKELTKRLQDGGATSSSILDTLLPLLYQSAFIAYSRSHVPAILEGTRSSDENLAVAAQELLRHLSEVVPEVIKTQVEALCQELQNNTPSDKQSEQSRAVDALKACASFVKRYPDDFPKDRKLLSALQSYALFSKSFKAAKYASTIILTTTDKKELRAKELLAKAIKRYESPAENQLAQLATMAQVCLYSAPAASVESSKIVEITVTNILRRNVSSRTTDHDESSWEEVPSEETSKKLLALKILFNRCRGGGEDENEYQELASSTLDVFIKLIKAQGEFAENEDTPSVTRNWLRLTAAKSIIKLCAQRRAVEELVKPDMLQDIAFMMIHRPHGVRRGLCTTIRQQLTANKLNARWLTPLLLLAFEPDHDLRVSTMTFLKARTAAYAQYQHQGHDANKGKVRVHNVIEITFARLLSLLAHHPDYPSTEDSTYEDDLLDFAKNIVFYLQCCANESNLSLIFHVAQRIKQAANAVTSDEIIDRHLYVLSDLSQAVIRNYADQVQTSSKNVNLLQTWPGKAQLPASLFKPINGHDKARQIAATNYLPEDVAGPLESLVRTCLKKAKSSAHSIPRTQTRQKRKNSEVMDEESDAEELSKSSKKAKKRDSVLPIRRTPNPKKRKSQAPISEEPSRKSARVSTASRVNYEESDEDEDDPSVKDIVPYNPTRIDASKTKVDQPTASESPAEEQVGREEDGDPDKDRGDENLSPEHLNGNHSHHDTASDENEENEVTTPAARPRRGGKSSTVTSKGSELKSKSKTKLSTPATAPTEVKLATQATRSTRGKNVTEDSSPAPGSERRRSKRTGR